MPPPRRATTPTLLFACFVVFTMLLWMQRTVSGSMGAPLDVAACVGERNGWRDVVTVFVVGERHSGTTVSEAAINAALCADTVGSFVRKEAGWHHGQACLVGDEWIVPFVWQRKVGEPLPARLIVSHNDSLDEYNQLARQAGGPPTLDYTRVRRAWWKHGFLPPACLARLSTAQPPRVVVLVRSVWSWLVAMHREPLTRGGDGMAALSMSQFLRTPWRRGDSMWCWDVAVGCETPEDAKIDQPTIVDLRRLKLRSHLALAAHVGPDRSLVVRYEDLLTDAGVDDMVSEVATRFALARHHADSTQATRERWHGGQARHAWLPASSFDASSELERFHNNYYRSFFSREDQAYVVAHLDLDTERRLGYSTEHLTGP